MSVNVFGTPITTDYVAGLPAYIGKEVTRKDRAHVALQEQYADTKSVNAQQYVDNLKANFGNGVCTKCLIYNATGDPITYVTSHDWYGHIGEGPYPVKIENGQWGAFLHVKKSWVASGSEGTVAYLGKNQDNVECEWLLCWNTPWGSSPNSAYTEINFAGYYESGVNWDVIYNLLNKNGKVKQQIWNGCESYVSIGSGTTSQFSGTMTLDGADVGLLKEFACKKMIERN